MPAPSLFISHGSPMLALADSSDPVVTMLEGLRTRFDTPRAIIILSAHRESADEAVEIDASKKFEALPDFSGFPKDLYQITYPLAGDPELASQMVTRVSGSVGGLPAVLVSRPLIDHGIWIPLLKAFKNPDFKIVPVSLPSGAEPRHYLALGQKLGEFRQNGVWIIGSGGAVHNLGQLKWSGKNAAPDPWALEFESWIVEKMQRGEVEELARFLEEGPEVTRAHPTPEHFYPLLFTVGAAQKGDRFELLHRGIEYGSLSMLSFALTS